MPRVNRREDYLTLNDARLYFKKLTGILFSRGSIYNWTRVGRKSYSGLKIKLGTRKIIGTLYTSKFWIQRFLDDLQK